MSEDPAPKKRRHEEDFPPFYSGQKVYVVTSAMTGRMIRLFSRHVDAKACRHYYFEEIWHRFSSTEDFYDRSDILYPIREINML